jgi:hypothetical protein
MKYIVLIILIAVASVGCRKCKECDRVEVDANGNTVGSNYVGKFCGDELDYYESAQVSNFGGTAHYECR